MSIAPLDLKKVSPKRQLWGCDPSEVENLLQLASDELTAQLAEVEKLERENRYYKQRLQESQLRESQLQETLVRVQKVSDQITANAQQEAELIVREAEEKARRLVHRAMEEAAQVESRISELRTLRQELALKFRQTLQFFERILEAEEHDSQRGATIRTLSRPRTTEPTTADARPPG